MKKYQLFSFLLMVSLANSGKASISTADDGPSWMNLWHFGKSKEENSPSGTAEKNHYSDGRFLAEAKAAYFRPTGSKFKEIYGDEIGLYGVEVSAQAWKRLYGWASASYASKKGVSSLGDPTRLTMVPIGLGVKYMHAYKHVSYYLGAGALTTYAHTRDSSPYLRHEITKWGIGGIAKAGLLVNINKCLFLDLFSDYSYTRIHYHGGEANFSGWSAGLGIGYRLN